MFASIVPVAFGASKHGSLYYTESYGAVTITGCENTVTTIAIPEKIGGNPVIEIADNAFKNQTQLKAFQPTGHRHTRRSLGYVHKIS